MVGGDAPGVPGWWWGIVEDIGEEDLDVAFDTGRNLVPCYEAERGQPWNGAEHEVCEMGVTDMLDPEWRRGLYTRLADWCLRNGVWDGDLVLVRVRVDYYNDTWTGEVDMDREVELMHVVRRVPTMWNRIGAFYAGRLT